MAVHTPTTLGLGQLPNSQTDIYDPAASHIGQVHNIILHNTNTTTETVELWKHNGTTAFKILKISLAADETFVFDLGNEGMVVDGSCKIQGKTTTASKVTYDINGSDRV